MKEPEETEEAEEAEGGARTERERMLLFWAAVKYLKWEQSAMVM